MNKLGILLVMFLMVGGCSPTEERKKDRQESARRSVQLPIAKKLKDQADQHRKSSQELQIILDKLECRNE